MGPGLGAMGDPGTSVAGAGAGAGVGGGAAAAGSTAGRGGSSTSQATEQRAGSGGSDGGDSQNVQYGKPTGNGASEEALKGPQGPPPREKYEFEKEMEGKPASKGVGGGALFPRNKSMDCNANVFRRTIATPRREGPAPDRKRRSSPF